MHYITHLANLTVPSRHRGALHWVGTIGSNIATDYFSCQ